MAAFPSWEEYARAHGVDPDTPMPTREEIAQVHENDDESNPLVQKRKKWREVSEIRNNWLDEMSRSGVTPGEMGIKNVHEQGQSIFSGWRENWNQALSNDPGAQAFAQSPQFKQWVSTYQDPWVAYQNYKQVQYLSQVHQGTNGAYQHWTPNAGGGYSNIGGKAGAYTIQQFDQFGREVSGPQAYNGAPGQVPPGPGGQGYAGTPTGTQPFNYGGAQANQKGALPSLNFSGGPPGQQQNVWSQPGQATMKMKG